MISFGSGGWFRFGGEIRTPFGKPPPPSMTGPGWCFENHERAICFEFVFECS